MRIAMLSWESLHSVSVGGVAAHVSELALALTKLGHEVHVFTRLAGQQRHHESIDGVHYHRCPYTGDSEFLEDVNAMCRAFVDRFFAIEDYVGVFDVVHAHDWLPGNAMIWIKQGRPDHNCVLTIHSTEYGRCGNVFHDGRSERVREQERASTYWADRVIAVSHTTGREIQWMYETPDWKISVVYNGVNPARFETPLDFEAFKRSHGLDPAQPTVLFCGRLVVQKGVDLLLDAIPTVLQDHPHATFVFAGDGELRASLEQQSRDLEISHAVRFLGHRNGQELVSWFKSADALCVPSRNEPFGIVVLEAWSAAKPVVVTQVGGPNEYVHHEVDGLKIYPRTDSVVWGLNRVLSDPDHARQMGINGQAEVKRNFSWDHIAAQTIDVYAKARSGPVKMPTFTLFPKAIAKKHGGRSSSRESHAA